MFVDICGKIANQMIAKLFRKMEKRRSLSWIRSFLLWLLVVIPQRLYVDFTFALHRRYPNIVEKLNMQERFTLGYILIARKNADFAYRI